MKNTLKNEKSFDSGIEVIASWTEVLECRVPGRPVVSWTGLECWQCEFVICQLDFEMAMRKSMEFLLK